MNAVTNTDLPGLEVSEATHADFVNSLAGDLELVPTEQDEHTKKLQRAGFTTKPSARNDWARSRASTDAAHRHAVAMGDYS